MSDRSAPPRGAGGRQAKEDIVLHAVVVGIAQRAQIRLDRLTAQAAPGAVRRIRGGRDPRLRDPVASVQHSRAPVVELCAQQARNRLGERHTAARRRHVRPARRDAPHAAAAEEIDALAKEAMVTPPDVVERMKKVLGM